MIDLRCGDCLEILPTLIGIDAVITDPPYGIRARTSYGANGRSNLALCNDFAPIIGDDQPFDPSPWLSFDKVILWGANHYCRRLPNAPCWLVWDKRDGITPNDNADCEIAWTNLSGPARLYHHLWNGMIKASEHTSRRVHPTQKAVSLMVWCIQQARLNAGSTILDPYMGSGSTGIAAVKLGFNFIGIEIDPGYFAIAKRRIEQAQLQPSFALNLDAQPQFEQAALDMDGKGRSDD